jgi:hypothetical protein
MITVHLASRSFVHAHLACVQMHSTQTGQSMKFVHGKQEIQLAIPYTAAQSKDSAAVTFVKHGSINDMDLPLLARLMTVANDLHLGRAMAGSPVVCAPRLHT